MPFGIHPTYLIILLAVVLIVFGPGKLPELGGAIGRGMREFRRASDGLTRPITEFTADPGSIAAPVAEPVAQPAAQPVADKEKRP